MTLKESITPFDISNAKAVYLPANLRKDSKYPFTVEDNLTMEIKGKSLVIRKQE